MDIKKQIRKIFSSKFNIVIIVMLVVAVVLTILSQLHIAILISALALLCVLCLTIAIRIIVDYKNIYNKYARASLHATQEQEENIQVEIKKLKRDMLIRIILFIFFAVVFLLATIKAI